MSGPSAARPSYLLEARSASVVGIDSPPPRSGWHPAAVAMANRSPSGHSNQEPIEDHQA
jgi:hypothetical protein